MNKKILRTREAEISKAGRLVFDAIFGDSRDFQQKLDEELEREESSDPDAIVVEGQSFVRCAVCAREQTLPSNVDVRVLERQGWRLVDAAWRCAFCIAK